MSTSRHGVCLPACTASGEHRSIPLTGNPRHLGREIDHDYRTGNDRYRPGDALGLLAVRRPRGHVPFPLGDVGEAYRRVFVDVITEADRTVQLPGSAQGCFHPLDRCGAGRETDGLRAGELACAQLHHDGAMEVRHAARAASEAVRGPAVGG